MPWDHGPEEPAHPRFVVVQTASARRPLRALRASSGADERAGQRLPSLRPRRHGRTLAAIPTDARRTLSGLRAGDRCLADTDRPERDFVSTQLIVFVTALLVAGLVFSEVRGPQRARFVFKPLASIGFLTLAVWLGALDEGHTYGHWMFAGLVLSFFGDVFLMADERPGLFLAGLGSFLLGHVAYAVGFFLFGVTTPATVGAGVLLVPVAVVVWRWLRPHLPSDMVVAVLAYIVVICSMEAFAAGATAAARAGGHPGAPLMLIGATLFWISDIAVARRQFVSPSPMSAVWGLPLYYGGQVVLALSIAYGGAAPGAS